MARYRNTTATLERVERLCADFKPSCSIDTGITVKPEKRALGAEMSGTPYTYCVATVYLDGVLVCSVVDSNLGSIRQETFDAMVTMMARSYRHGYNEGGIDQCVGSRRLAV